MSDDAAQRFQLHLVLPYKLQPREDPRIERWLERGYRITQYQRVTDREALVTLDKRGAGDFSRRGRASGRPG